MKPDEFTRLQASVERLKKEFHQATGAYDAMLARLKESFDCSSLEEAEDHLKELEERSAKMTNIHRRRLQEFEEKFKSVLEAANGQ